MMEHENSFITSGPDSVLLSLFMSSAIILNAAHVLKSRLESTLLSESLRMKWTPKKNSTKYPALK